MPQLAQEHRSFVGAHVDQGTRAQLREVARDEDRSLASVIRRALDRELARVRTDPPGGEVKLPGRKQFEQHDPYSAIARGEQVTLDTTRAGTIDDGSLAYEERILEARRYWPQGDAAAYEPLDRHGRRWRDRGAGAEFKALTGAPLLSAGEEATRGVACFLVHSGRLWFLRPADYPEELRGFTSTVRGQELTKATPGPDVRSHI
jgi:hypothetical protein